MLAILCSAVFLKLDCIIKAILIVGAVLTYNVVMHYPYTSIFDQYDNELLNM